MSTISFEIKDRTDEEIAEMRKAFQTADRDNNEAIDKVEFIKFSKSQGISKDTAELIFYAFGSHDEDISFEGFKAYLDLLRECKSQNSELPLWRAFFRKLDKDNNGSISFEEFLQFGLIACPNVSEENLRKEFNSVDTNHNGTIDFDEMMKIIHP